MFVVAMCMFLVTMSSVLFVVSEDKISIDTDHKNLQAFVLQHDEIEEPHDETFYRELIKNPTDEFAIVNSDRTVKFATQKLTEVHGIDLSKDKNLNVLSLVHPKDLTELANTLMDYNQDLKERSGIGPLRIKTASGSYVTYLMSLIPIFDEEGNKVASAVVLKDISKPLGEQVEKENGYDLSFLKVETVMASK